MTDLRDNGIVLIAWWCLLQEIDVQGKKAIIITDRGNNGIVSSFAGD